MCPVLIPGTSKSEIRFNAPYRADYNYDSTGTQRRDGYACHLCGFVSTVSRKYKGSHNVPLFEKINCKKYKIQSESLKILMTNRIIWIKYIRYPDQHTAAG